MGEKVKDKTTTEGWTLGKPDREIFGPQRSRRGTKHNTEFGKRAEGVKRGKVT